MDKNPPMVSIGPYRGRPVAQGGFATVYHAGLPCDERWLAVKWAHPDAGPDIVTSLTNEFAVLDELFAPWTPRAVDFGWAEGRPYLVTEWIEGRPLWSDGGLPDDELFGRVLRQAARALSFIHARGWVHGDLKPDNFLWQHSSSQSGVDGAVLKLLDFGLARPVGDLDRPRGAGTVGYLAPEFLEMRPADARADWYSLGIILYEWMFGVRPFAADDPADEVAAHLEQQPDFERPMRRSVPDWATGVTARLLLKTPDARGADEYSILAWLSQFDPMLDPETIFAEHVFHHHLSENRRLTPGEQTIAAAAAKSGSPALQIHNIEGDNLSIARIRRGLSRQSCNNRDCPSVMQSGYEAAGEGRRLTFLPWDHEVVRAYLRSITGDQDFATRWTGPVMRATGGLPDAVNDFVGFAIRNESLVRDDGAWDLDPGAIGEWVARPESLCFFTRYLGEQTADERRLCDWISVGRGRIHFDILRELWGGTDARLKAAFDRLRKHGVIVPSAGGGAPDGFEWRFRLDGLHGCWRAQIPPALRRRLALQLGAAIESALSESDAQAQEVLAELFFDARSWDKSVHHAVTAAAAHLKAGRQDAAMPYIALAAAAATEIPPGRSRQYWMGRAQMMLGDYQKACGQVEEARHTYRLLLVEGRRADDRRLLAETLKDLGDLYRQIRQFEKGVRALRRARQIFEAMGDQVEVARTLNNLGNMYWVSADYTEAQNYYSQALALARSLGDPHIEALVLSNLGVAYKSTHDYLRAEECYRESLAIKERLNSPADVAMTLNNLGVIALDQGLLHTAEESLRRAVELNRQVGAEAEVVFNHGNLIQVHLERGDLREAIALAESTIQQADLLGDPASGADLRALLAEAYLRAGDFSVASQCLEEARKVAVGQTNDDLHAHIALVQATRLFKLRRLRDAVNGLDAARDSFARAEVQRIRIDSIILRLSMAVAMDEPDIAAACWREGQKVAGLAPARHKVVQLALARLPRDPARGFPRETLVLIDSLLADQEDWQWTGEYRLWQARYHVLKGEGALAEKSARDAVERFRRDGNWEFLWQALVTFGQICLHRTDYEPALSAFEEARRILEVITNTIDDEESRATYLDHPLASRLTKDMAHIIQLTS